MICKSGGDFMGRDFIGSNFLRGNFLGGNFHREGAFIGETFRGGIFIGSNFLLGNFLGGIFWGPIFRGAIFLMPKLGSIRNISQEINLIVKNNTGRPHNSFLLIYFNTTIFTFFDTNHFST